MAKKTKKKTIIEPMYVELKPFCAALKCAIEIASNADGRTALHGVVFVRLARHCRGGGLHIVACDGHRIGAFSLQESTERPWVIENMRSEPPELFWLSLADAKVLLANVDVRAKAWPQVELNCEARATEIRFSVGDGGRALEAFARDTTRENEYPWIWRDELTGQAIFERAINTRLSAQYLRLACDAAKAIGNQGVALSMSSDTEPALVTFSETKGFVVIMPRAP